VVVNTTNFPYPTTLEDIKNRLKNSFENAIKNKPNIKQDFLLSQPNSYLRHCANKSKQKGFPNNLKLQNPDEILDWSSYEISLGLLKMAILNNIGICKTFDKARSQFTRRGFGKGISIESCYECLIIPLYFSYFRSVISALALSGVIVTLGKFLTRNSRKDIIWSPHDGNWDIDKNKHLTQGQIINYYKLVVNRKESRWLPGINEDLDVLKIQREEITYSFIQILQEPRIKAFDDIEKSFPHVIAFQKTIYGSLEQIKTKISLPSNYSGDYYNPVDRFKELERIFKKSNQIYRSIGIL